MFHLPVGEMTPTLQNVAMLLGLPCAGRAVGAEDVALSWRDDLLAQFAGVQRNDRALPYRPFSSNHGPTKRWLLQFSVSTLISNISYLCLYVLALNDYYHFAGGLHEG